MAKTILTKNQQKILDAISDNKNLCSIFYLSGGTALAEFYFQNRLSEDLDFFSEEEFDVQSINVFFKKNQKILNIKNIDFQQSFNRNLFFLKLQDGDVIKMEFTYYPFQRIEKKKKVNKLFVDSLIDIAVNKVFTIYQKPRSRDFIDLYYIIKKTKWKISDLVKKARIKFDTNIDPIQFGSKLMLAKEVKDYPIMLAKTNHALWQEFFINEAKKLKKNVLR